MKLLQRIRPCIQNLKAYQSARSQITKARMFLDANESPESLSLQSDPDIHRYPSQQPASLLSKLAEIYQVDQNRILITRGTDEGIDLVLRTFAEPGEDRIIITPPTYGMYRVSAQIQNARVIEVPLIQEEGFSLDARTLLASVTPELKIVFLCSPNNPTGNCLAVDAVRACLEALKDRALVVIDEAYIEFSEQESWVKALSQYDNLIILRTFSKAWAMAGARFGVLIGHPELIRVFRKVLAPYPLPVPVITQVNRVLTGDVLTLIGAHVEEVRVQRNRLQRFLEGLEEVLHVYPSQTNYLLARFKDSHKILSLCKNSGIILRDRSQQPGLDNCIRITVGSAAQNNELIDLLSTLDQRAN
ncbi:MAG: histidinol-phosphate transaminase [Candidatus Thiosymbion ectosymbiont of Robbea hypermnestra]|nr:histidinol-phosphate transaminase [Candidatus Thiosymbion ectosymbiont of Robbea hypermnestra]